MTHPGGGGGTGPGGGGGTGPGRQKCPEERPHLAHPVPAAGCITGFTCPGLAVGELDRLLDEAFGPLPAHAGA